MPESNRLKSEIEGVFECYNQFLSQIDENVHGNREECISTAYHAILDEKTPWLSELLTPESPSENTSPTASQQQKPIHMKYMKKIERNPAEKAHLIKEFLEYFPEISLADRLVLAENFKNLTYKDLYHEFENLTQIFNV
ncbi:MAG: hypothetical protein E4G98_03820 [Promethearchaeota archaeon]|nr:MAG: hypothetical protein E4G98_03820 [Candidatus Lokiarchaeota archaeon]